MNPSNLIHDEEAKEAALRDLESQLDLTTDQLKKLAQTLKNDMNIGLQQCDTGCDIPMLPSWIIRRPTGQEKGEYIGLDLSGSYVRVYLVTLQGQGRIKTRQMKYTVKEYLKKGHVSKLIEFMTTCVDGFLSFINKGDSNSKNPLPLGLCISFPLVQTAINNAHVLRWTKDFAITGAEKKNLVELLQTSFRRREIPVVVKAVVNGAAGCLLAHSYRSLDTLLACTVSSGSNAAYWEKVSQAPKLQSRVDAEEMIINTEWGSFGDRHSETIPHTFYDIRVNRQSVNPGIHVYEKMCSGLYLGEIVRLIMVDFLDRRLLFDAHYSKELNTPYFFEAAYMSAIERDESEELEEVKHIIENVLNLKTSTLTDRHMVKRICELVGRRAARLIAAGMSSIISKRDGLETGLTISVEGTIYEHYANFPDRVNKALQELYGEQFERINIGIARDGNGIGAALAAMLVSTS